MRDEHVGRKDGKLCGAARKYTGSGLSAVGLAGRKLIILETFRIGMLGKMLFVEVNVPYENGKL